MSSKAGIRVALVIGTAAVLALLGAIGISIDREVREKSLYATLQGENGSVHLQKSTRLFFSSRDGVNLMAIRTQVSEDQRGAENPYHVWLVLSQAPNGQAVYLGDFKSIDLYCADGPKIRSVMKTLPTPVETFLGARCR